MPVNNLPERTFGVEIEASGLSYDAAAESITDSTGYESYAEDYNHRCQDYWKIVEDGSLYRENSFEAVSPILSGESGIREVRAVAQALLDGGARVSKACGLHVHIGISDLSPEEVATIVTRYARFERQIDAFMPPSRRGEENNWCRSVISWGHSLETFFPPTDMNEVMDEQCGRSSKINLECYSRQGTIEFRQHSGTLNRNKIENWVRFLLHFVESCRVSTSAGTSVDVSEDEVTTRRAARTISIPVDDTLFRGVPESVVSFLNGRAEAFANTP